MNAAATARVVAIGSELLTLGRTDTNSPYIAGQLQDVGLAVESTTVVGDDVAPLTDALGHAIQGADLVVCTGGLGPTSDDRTRDVVAALLGLSLDEDARVVAAIRARFDRRGMVMPDINRRQAQVPRGAAVLDNVKGTAPGLWVPSPRGAVLLLPGPPREMYPMLSHAIDAFVVPRWGGERARRRTLICAGRSESWVDEQAQPIYGPWADESPAIVTTILASLGIIELHLAARGADVAAIDRRLDAAVDALVARLGADVVSRDGTPLEAAVGAALVQRGWRVALAESCTGGLVTGRLTDVAGSSAYVDRAFVTYSNEAKVQWLGVPEALVAEHGAVSDAVAAAMAEGVRARAGTDIGVAITGIAGPGGGSEAKPVGLVWFGVSGPQGTITRRALFPGDRAAVRTFATSMALDLLRRYLAGGAS